MVISGGLALCRDTKILAEHTVIVDLNLFSFASEFD
jgi:hypothetical protein